MQGAVSRRERDFDKEQVLERANAFCKRILFSVVAVAMALAMLVIATTLAPRACAWADQSQSIGAAPSLPADAGEPADAGIGITAQELSSSELVPAAVSQRVATHTQTEIRAFIAAHPFNMSQAATYSSAPSTASPYAAGQISSVSEQEALNALNTMRYIAGLPADVTIDETYRSKAQAGALVNAVNRVLSHTPTQPSDMPDDLYQLGYSGNSSSNIAAGYSNPAASILGYMDDFGTNNHGVVGHRVWLLDWNMGKTGFGQVNSYGATYVFDNSRTTSYTDVILPAANMPTCLFDKSSGGRS